MACFTGTGQGAAECSASRWCGALNEARCFSSKASKRWNMVGTHWECVICSRSNSSSALPASNFGIT